MDTGGIIAIVIVGVLFLLALYILKKSIYVVRQAEGLVIERLGRFHRILNSGIHMVVPFIDSPRQFTWRKTHITSDGSIIDETITANRIDLRESVFNFLRQEVYTKDTVLLDVNALMFYRIFDIKKAIYEVDDLQTALSNTAQTQLKEVFGNMNFTEALTSQTSINDHLIKEFSKLFGGWGIHVERMELLDLSPKRSVEENLKKQMVAERSRRADFIRSEGVKAAMRITAEGQKQVAVNMGIAEQEGTRKRSEGEADAKVEIARSEAVALETISSMIEADGASQTQYMLSEKFLEFFRTASMYVEHKTLYLPYKLSGLTGIVQRLPSVYGSKAKQKADPKKFQTSEVKKEFNELD